jgi:hypothetical protein
MATIGITVSRGVQPVASPATGAVRTWTSAPPTAGPTTNDADPPALSLLFAST